MERVLIKATPPKTGASVKVCGWVWGRRNHGQIIFIDLKDASGIIQCVFLPNNDQVYKTAETLRTGFVVEIIGQISERPKGMVNPDLATGKIELQVDNLIVLNESLTPPFALDTDGLEISEETRMKYRYLDLRRDRLQKNLRLRHRVIQFMRDWLNKHDFVEIETPIISKSTPEGARDYMVPSHQQPGKFYALPQSPQQYKQLLMVAGFEKYFQIARCFRDEDTRGDRQPEFTQLDIEMSFVNQDDILNLIEKLYTDIIEKLFPEKKISQKPFPRLTYKEAMEKYGSDKPDLRKNKDDPDELAFVFVLDWPMFEKKHGGSLGAMHHPFTLPKTDDIAKIKMTPLDIISYQHDFVLNGYEVGGGSIRIHRPELLETIFEILGHTKEEIQNQFGHLLEAFKYGVPPHGGIAPGIDRFIMILANEPNIREVFAFPKTGDGRDLMMDAPSEINEQQLEELGLSVKKK